MEVVNKQVIRLLSLNNMLFTKVIQWKNGLLEDQPSHEFFHFDAYSNTLALGQLTFDNVP